MAKFREVAVRLQAEENLDFYLDIKPYKLLFAEQDRLDTATRLFQRYLAATADRLVTLPDGTHSKLKQMVIDKKEAPADVFDQASQDTLLLMSDNIYTVFLREHNKPAAVPAAAAP